jgi:hypothetical protein
MDSRTNPLAPSLIGDDSIDGEIAGENEPLKMHEEGAEPPAGALDYLAPASGLLDNPIGDPGLLSGSRDPDLPNSLEADDRPGEREGNTPYDAEGTMGSEGK